MVWHDVCIAPFQREGHSVWAPGKLRFWSNNTLTVTTKGELREVWVWHHYLMPRLVIETSGAATFYIIARSITHVWLKLSQKWFSQMSDADSAARVFDTSHWTDTFCPLTLLVWTYTSQGLCPISTNLQFQYILECEKISALLLISCIFLYYSHFTVFNWIIISVKDNPSNNKLLFPNDYYIY